MGRRGASVDQSIAVCTHRCEVSREGLRVCVKAGRMGSLPQLPDMPRQTRNAQNQGGSTWHVQRPEIVIANRSRAPGLCMPLMNQRGTAVGACGKMEEIKRRRRAAGDPPPPKIELETHTHTRAALLAPPSACWWPDVAADILAARHKKGWRAGKRKGLGADDKTCVIPQRVKCKKRESAVPFLVA